MYCISCHGEQTKVIDSRISEDWKSIRRRRECENCQYRFTTYEKVELLSLIIEKSWNKKEKYIRSKLKDSILKAINKRNLSIETINNLIKELEFCWWAKTKITSKEMWRDVLAGLLKLDEVAYIRYASVHLNFETTKNFTEFINRKMICKDWK